MRCLGLLVLALVLGQAQSRQPPLPYVDHGACPFECCVYRDWIAERTIQAFDGAPMGTQHEMFSIAKGERVTAMTGTVITRQAGVVRIQKAMDLLVSSKHFPAAPPDTVNLAPGDRLYLLTNQGEAYMSGWFKGRVLDSFDTSPFASAQDCPKRKEGCAGILERQPRSEWWVKVRSRTGHIGWVRVPTNAPGFSRMDACGGER